MNMSLTLSGFTSTTQALLLAVLVGGALLVLVGLSINNPLLRRMGVRNILRHRAQTLIMLCGLMLFSAFLTASFGLQDSFSHSVVVDRLTKVGDVDESVTGPFTQDQVESALTQIRQQAAVQAATAVYFNPLGANFHAQRTGITRTNQYILAAPPDFDRVYGALRDNQGHPVSITDLRSNEVLLSHSAATSLDIKPGDRLQITLNEQKMTLDAAVRAILSNDPVVTGGELAVDASYPEMILPLATLQQFNLQSVHQSLPPNTICIKNVGPGKSPTVLSFLERFFHTPTDTRAATPAQFQSTTIHPLKPGRTEDDRWNPVAGKGDFIASSAARQFDLLLPVLTGNTNDADLLQPGTQIGLGIRLPFNLDQSAQASPPLFIRSVDSGSPAEKAGLRPGDIIVTINGFPPFIKQGLVPQVVSQLQGSAPVQLQVQHPGADRTISIHLASAAYPATPLVSTRMLPGNILYVRLTRFERGVYDLINNAVQQAGTQLKGLILDLRGNGGGDAGEERRIVSLFVHNQIIGALVDRQGQSTEIRTDDSVPLLHIHLVALIDRGCASACDATAMNIHDLHLGRLVGEKTAGIASGPSLDFTLDDGSIVSVPLAFMQGPAGEIVASIGVPPDDEVHPTLTDLAAGHDPVLERALQVL